MIALHGFFVFRRMNMRAEAKEQTQKLTEKVLNHQVQGEVYILTQGRIWKAILHYDKPYFCIVSTNP
jgi:hypothetical protein